MEFVERGELGLASGHRPDGGYERVWFEQIVAADEVAFEADVYLLRKATAEALKAPPESPAVTISEPPVQPGAAPSQATLIESTSGDVQQPASKRVLRLHGLITPEVWNRFGTRILPKMRAGSDLKIIVELAVEVDAAQGQQLELDLRQIIDDVGLDDSLQID